MTLKERFEDKYIPEPNSGCWLWIAGTSSNGYGQFSVGTHKNKKSKLAHRMSWELNNGNIPDGLLVCHKCDNTHCVNPSHLFLGTSKDNTRDMFRKGRNRHSAPKKPASGDHWRSFQRNLPHGEGHHQTNLKVEDIQAIRSSSQTGVALAKYYKVSTKTISRIKRREVWRKVS